MPETNSLMYICGFLLKKCAEHDKCSALKYYIRSQETAHNFSAETRYTRYRSYSTDNLNTILIIPPDDFVHLVKKMEEIFRNYFTIENCTTGKIAKTIFDNMFDLKYVPPCTCFPIIYLKKLYIRMQIYYVIKFNNAAFKTGRARRKYFAVSNL